MSGTNDAREGLMAFLEQQTPSWTGMWSGGFFSNFEEKRLARDRKIEKPCVHV
jgi:hypothetical protein